MEGKKVKKMREKENRKRIKERKWLPRRKKEIKRKKGRNDGLKAAF